jgi:5-formyltetrahydrofolate cyclo-ligase
VRQDHIPRGRTIPTGAVPVLARGLGHMVPTYSRRRPGSPSNGQLGPALLAKGSAHSIAIMPLADPTLLVDPNSLAEAKAALRRQALERRRALDPAVRPAFAVRLAEIGLDCARRWHPRVVAAFASLSDEPDTSALLAALQRAGFPTALPVALGRGEPLIFRAWRTGEPLVTGAMGVREPGASASVVDPDLLFTPLAAFDRRGNRVGYGAGHYDRTLAQLRARGLVRAVGVAFSVAEVPAAPAQAHDQRLDFILTEREWIEAPGAG